MKFFALSLAFILLALVSFSGISSADSFSIGSKSDSLAVIPAPAYDDDPANLPSLPGGAELVHVSTPVPPIGASNVKQSQQQAIPAKQPIRGSKQESASKPFNYDFGYPVYPNSKNAFLSIRGSPFGPRTSPCAGCSSYHQGQDLLVAYKPVYAVADGVVITSHFDSCAGNIIEIDHGKDVNGKDVLSRYFHLSEFKVKVGALVKKGQQIAVSGGTGTCLQGPHLHFEIKIAGNRIDPWPCLTGNTCGGVAKPIPESASLAKIASGPACNSQYDSIVLADSQKHELDPKLVCGLIEVESSFRKYANSHAIDYYSMKAYGLQINGARGLMQVMPSTARNCPGFQTANDVENKLYLPDVNIACGMQILANYMRPYKDNVACGLMAYNSGPGSVPATKDCSKNPYAIDVLAAAQKFGYAG